MILRHVVFPLFQVGNNRLANGILSFVSDFAVLIPLLILYPLDQAFGSFFTICIDPNLNQRFFCRPIWMTPILSSLFR